MEVHTVELKVPQVVLEDLEVVRELRNPEALKLS